MGLTAAEIYGNSFARGLMPDPALTISEWADKFRVVPSESSAEPGRWRTSRVPYLREIMDCLSPASPIQRVVFQKPHQIAGTEAAENLVGYVMHLAPGPIMFVEPTVDVAKKVSRQRIQPTITDTPVLRNLVKESWRRESGNTTLLKEFQGGMLVLTGANSAAGLRFMAVRFLILDEIDGYPLDVEGEGDPVTLAINRTTTFARCKILMLSTPKIRGASRIERAYENSDQREYHVPCPLCSHLQPLRFSQLRDKDKHGIHHPEKTKYECESCSKLIPEFHKPWMLENGRWVPQAPRNKIAGFKLSGLYRPLGWGSWASIMEKYLEAKKDLALMKTFTNTELAETWEEEAEKISLGTLTRRREKYGEVVPATAGLLTAGVDVHADRLEVLVDAWGRGEESWDMDWKAFQGNPTQESTWQLLWDYLQKTWQHESGAALRIFCTCIDSGAYTKHVYGFVKPRQGQRIFATKGLSSPGMPLVGRPTTSNLAKVKLFPIGVDTAKDILFARLKIEESGPGYMHSPARFDDEFFKQLSAEKAVTKYRRGFPYREYRKVTPQARNEAIDLKVLNFAALAISGVNVDKIVDALSSGNLDVTAPVRPRWRVISRGVGDKD
ncbi:MAG: phage terminase large subunit family protein [Candidatus Eisenbacteria bacterium]|nr:phage terminase large subunit family protein [Candidatus Eisenbacteria bacterium]